jgi:intraflagellar transport protein 172
MKLKHLKTVLVPQDGAARVTAVAWAPSNKKFAVVTVDRVVQLFDDHGERRDKFSTKPADPNLGKQSYQVTGLAFSPDSTRVAVGQSDNIAFVYTIGENWGEKKVISGKSVQKSAVTCLVWPSSQSNYVVGLADGKVKSGAGKGSKTHTLYSSGSYVVSLAVSPSGKGIISGHADGTIIRFMFEDDGSGLAGGAVVKHSCPPYALSWSAADCITAAGCDRRVQFYSQRGKKLQQFDYSKVEEEKEFTCASTSPSGEALVLGSFDRLRVFRWVSESGSWEEATLRDIPHFYTVTALSWKRDGSRLLAGSLCGALEMFDCYLKRVIYNKRFEMTYVALSQVIVTNMSTGSRVNMKSRHGYEVKQVQVLGGERYLVGHTSHTLLLGDLASCKLSEVAWQSGGNEKLYLENENVCMIFNAGELSLVEYGVNEVLGSVRTEHMSPHLISVRINERKHSREAVCKKLAYLVDLRTICIMDLSVGTVLATVPHDSIINWLELNETGRKLLFRDRRLRLHLYDVETQSHTSLLSYCSYVQWVPQSDVVVAQNKTSLCVWYNINIPDKTTMFPLKGEVTSLERRGGRTEVMVKSGVDTVTYTLDEGLIEFGTAVDDRDYLRALSFLEGLEMSGESEAMWGTLGQLSLQDRKLKIAERCYAALGDVAKVRYLREVTKLADKMTLETGQDGTTHYLVEAKMAALNKRLKQAEAILLDRGELDMVMTMYQELHRWEDAIEVAAARSHPDLATLKATHYQHLLDSGQEERAGKMKEREGDLPGAISLYMKAGLPGKAAKLISQHQELSSQPDLLRHIASSLSEGGQFEKAGELFEKAQELQQAMEAYRRAGTYRRAVELARSAYPTQVVKLEEEWGVYLCGRREYEAAIVHLIEAGRLEKAAEAAILSRQWSKAVQIVDMLQPDQAGEHYQLLASHFASIRDLPMAEKYFLKANMAQEAMDMYVRVEDWRAAHRVAVGCMPPDEIRELYVAQAGQMEREGRLSEAEQLFLLVNEPDQAISMYKKARQYDPMVRLVAQFHSDLITETHLLLAQELEAEGAVRQAEKHYLEAGDWKSAVSMYREKGQWEDGHRVAKNGGGVSAANQVAYLWAQNLGGDSAVKLLSKFGQLEAAVDCATDHFEFDFAFSIAKVALKEKVADIHLKKALHLEDEGKFREAEESFTAAGKPKEAVLMYVHQQVWDDAQRVAELHCPESVSDVLIGQARVAFDQKNYQKAEGHLLRADRPDLVAKFYKEADMWQDALRIMKDYLPHQLDEFQKEMAGKSGTSYRDLLSQARTWEQSGEHSRAIDVYLQVTSSNCPDHDVLQDSWEKAVDLSLKFAPTRSVDVVTLVSDRLAHLGRYVQAGEMFLSVEMVKEGLDMYMAGEAWDKAREIARNIAPRYVEYVEQAYVEYLREQNRPDEMQGVDPEGALRMYCEKGQWQQCLQLAEKQGAVVLEKYVALYAAHLIKTSAPLTALQLFNKYGTSPNPQVRKL